MYDLIYLKGFIHILFYPFGQFLNNLHLIEETNKEEGYHIESLNYKSFDLQIGILYLFFMIIIL